MRRYFVPPLHNCDGRPIRSLSFDKSSILRWTYATTRLGLILSEMKRAMICIVFPILQKWSDTRQVEYWETLPHLVLTNFKKVSHDDTGTRITHTASIPPCQMPFSCLRIQKRLSFWKGKRVNFRFFGCSASRGVIIGMLASRSPQTSLSSLWYLCNAIVDFSACMTV
jgi:hypothetical protein